MKKAQLMAHPFYYIFVMIVIAMVLFFGVRVINGVLKTQEQAKFAEFRINFRNAVNNVYLQNPGSKISYSLPLPNKVTRVCFSNQGDKTRLSGNSDLFISFDVDNLTPRQNNYCINVKSGKLNFILENKILSQKTIVEIYESTN